jgi:hydrogenase small subunit
MVKGQTKVLWLQAMSCSGCSVSFLNADAPGPVEVLTEMLSLVYHSTISAAQGTDAMRVIDQVTDGKDYVLVVEGAIPTEMPEACVIGGRPLAALLLPAIKNAKAVVAAGTCAAFGGIPSGEGNAVGAVGVKDFMQRQGIDFQNRLLNCPGCPVHPQCLLGTVAYVISKGYPPVIPGLLTPAMFYEHSVHDECPRFHYWEKEVFAAQFGEEGCLFKLGCLGPLSHSTCPKRQWNGGVNWCVRASAPCIGCTSELFGKQRDFPFYRKGEESHAVHYEESQRKGVSQ